MNIYTESIIINSPIEKAFSYISNYENITKWSKNFIFKIEKKDKDYFVTIPTGTFEFKIIADEKTGVIDLVINNNPTPTRVIPFMNNSSIYLFTLIFPPEMPSKEIEKWLKWLREELEMLKQQIESL